MKLGAFRSVRTFMTLDSFDESISRIIESNKNKTHFVSFDPTDDKVSIVDKPQIKKDVNQTFDGEHFESVTYTKLYAHHWYFKNDKTKYRFEKANFIDYISHLGGIASTIFFIMTLLGRAINRRVIVAELIKNLYFFNNKNANDEADEKSPEHPVQKKWTINASRNQSQSDNITMTDKSVVIS